MGEPNVICLRGADWRLYPCRLWTGGRNRKGYGRRHITGSNPKRYVAVHRESLELFLGRPLRPGLLACHHCDVPGCYEPMHLYEGTQSENLRDMYERHRGMPAGRPQITDAEKAGVRGRYAAGGITHLELAEEFGMERTTVWRIVGSSHERGVVTDEIREEMRRRFAAGGVPRADLAREFGLSAQTTYRILRGMRPPRHPDIIARYAEGGISQKELAREFGLAHSSVSTLLGKAGLR